MQKLLIIVFITTLSFISFAQEYEHDHKANEIGFGLGASLNIEERNWAPNLHIHYIRAFGEHHKYGLSAGFENIFDVHQHKSLTIGAHYNIFDLITFGLAPGISKSSNEENWEYTIHFEAVSEFELGKIHLGPMAEYGIGQDHSHLTVGLHLGIGF